MLDQLVVFVTHNLTDDNDRAYEAWICEVEVLGNYETMSIDEYEKLVG